MKHPTYQQVLKNRTVAKRNPKRPYRHREGAFLLTASFRTEVDAALIQLAGKLTAHFTQKALASLLGTSTSTIGKMVRIYFAQQTTLSGNGKQSQN